MIIETKIFLVILIISFLNIFNGYGQSQFDLSIGSSLSLSEFQWSIAGDINGENPNVLSELVYKNIIRSGVFFEGHYHMSNNFSVGVLIKKYYTIKGSGSDLDYLKDNRKSPSYELSFVSERGGEQVFNIQIMRKLIGNNDFKFFVGIFGGISNQVLSMSSPKYVNLNSAYSARSHMIGAKSISVFKIAKSLELDLAISCRRNLYEGVGNWNLIEIFEHPVSFKHNSKGFDIKTQVVIKKQFSSISSVFLTAGGLVQSISKGIDKGYLATGRRPITQFNGARYKMLSFGLGYRLLW